MCYVKLTIWTAHRDSDFTQERIDAFKTRHTNDHYSIKVIDRPKQPLGFRVEYLERSA